MALGSLGRCLRRQGHWHAALAFALPCLLSPLGVASADECRDQDEQWKAHGSNCQKMKRLCSDPGYGSLVRKWCPASCGLCQPEETPTANRRVEGTDDAVVLVANSSVLTIANASWMEQQKANSSVLTVANASWIDTQKVLVHETTTTTIADGSSGDDTVATTEASANSTTTTTREVPYVPQPENCTTNSTRLSKVRRLPHDDQVEAVLVSVSPASAQTLMGIDGAELLNVDELNVEAPIVQANQLDTQVEVDDAGSNTTTTSTLRWDLGEEVEREDEVVQKLDATLRGKQELRRGKKAPRKMKGRERGLGNATAEVQDNQVLWIGLDDNASSEEGGVFSGNESDAQGKKTTTGLQEKQLPRPSQTELEEDRRQCPEGYERLVGDVYGADQFSGRQNIFAESKEECGRRCTRTPGCGSFEFSPSRKKCFRNSQTRPTHHQDRLDFIFCRRAPCPSLKTEEACVGPAIAADKHSAEISLRPGSYCIWSGGACQAPMACTEKDCFLPDGGLPGMDLPSWQTLWISRAGLEATMLPTSILR